MADNMQLPPPGGPAGFSAVATRPGSSPRQAVLAAALLLAAGALLGLLGGVIWAAVAPRVVYQMATLHPPTAFATNPETNAFIAADGIYTFIALGGGALLGLAGYLLGVRRYGPVPMIGIILGAIAAAFLAKWLGPVLTGQDTFNAQLGSSKVGALLRAPISLGASGALAFWPVAAAFVVGGLELASVMRAKQLSQKGGPGSPGPRLPFGRYAQRVRRGAGPERAGQGQAAPGPPAAAEPAAAEPAAAGPAAAEPAAAEPAAAGPGPAEPGARAAWPQAVVPPDPASAGNAPRPWFPAGAADDAAFGQPWLPSDPPAAAGQPWLPADPPSGASGRPVSCELPPDADGSAR